MKLWLGIVLCSLPVVAAAQLYQWVDARGQTQIGPQPPANVIATPVALGANAVAPVIPGQQLPKSAPTNLQKPVVLYATSWCGYCRKARAYFKQHGITYIEYDIEKDKAAYQRYKKLGGKGVPVITIGSETVFGFSPAKFEKVYNK